MVTEAGLGVFKHPICESEMVQDLALGAMAAAQHKDRLAAAHSAPHRPRHRVLFAAISRLLLTHWTSGAALRTSYVFESRRQGHDKDGTGCTARLGGRSVLH